MDDISIVRPAKFKARGETRQLLLDALAPGAVAPSNSMALRDVATRLRADHDAVEGDTAWAFAGALDALDKAGAWEPALAAADPNPDRFRDAARHLAAKVAVTERCAPWPDTLQEALQILSALSSYDEVSKVKDLLRRTPIPASVTDVLLPRERGWKRPAVAPEPKATPTVLLRFQLDDLPVSWPMALTPGRTYVLEALASVDEWPEDVKHLMIELESDVPLSVIECPAITIPADGQVARGYLVPKQEIGRTNPVTFTPRATFIGIDGSQVSANVVGQRSLRVSTFDPLVVGVGRPMVAQRIVELLGELSGRIPDLLPQDRRDLIHLLEATDRFAALANERPDLQGLDERGFQAKLKQALSMDSAIGTRIQEAPRLAAGITDLMLGRLVDELKMSHAVIDIDDADRFVRQPTQYASAADCPISVLTILDDSPKTDPPGVASNYMRWAIPQLHGASNPSPVSMVAVVIIPIGFPVPSYWSTLSPGSVEHGS